MINTSLESDSDIIKYEFDLLLQSVAKSILEKKDSDELSILNN